MRNDALPHRHSHWFDDLGPEKELLSLGGVILAVMTIAIYFYASTL